MLSKVEMLHFKSPDPQPSGEPGRARIRAAQAGAAQTMSGAAASGVATTKEKLSSR